MPATGAMRVASTHPSPASTGPSFVSRITSVESQPPPITDSDLAFIGEQMEAFADIDGVAFPEDSGAGDPGAFWYPSSFKPEVVRSFAMSEHWADIAPVRDNYETLLEHRAVRVLFDGEEATGVEYVPSSARDTSGARTVLARKEVIIATGTIYTPQLLQASGIGPSSVLENAGIDVLVDLPGVGANFQDHPLGAGAMFFCK